MQHAEQSSREGPIIVAIQRYNARSGVACQFGTQVDLLSFVCEQPKTTTQEIVAMFNFAMLQLSGNRKRLALLTVLTFITLC